jgi:hypothetical protein
LFGIKIQQFDVFHDGYRYGQPAPSFYLILPETRDSYKVAEWRVKELGLTESLREKGRLGYDIPFVGVGVADSIILKPYIKHEITNFLCAIGEYPGAYDYSSSEVCYPRTGYTDSPVYEHYMLRVRRSERLRGTVGDWFR